MSHITRNAKNLKPGAKPAAPVRVYLALCDEERWELIDEDENVRAYRMQQYGRPFYWAFQTCRKAGWDLIDEPREDM